MHILHRLAEGWKPYVLIIRVRPTKREIPIMASHENSQLIKRMHMYQTPIWKGVKCLDRPTRQNWGFTAFIAAVMMLIALASPTSASAKIGQTSITLVGGVSTAVQRSNTTWDSSKTLLGVTPDPNDQTGNTGTVSWKVTVTKIATSGKTIETDGYLTVQNTGAYPASIGNIIVNLQVFTKTCGKYKNIWISHAADMADADNGNAGTSDDIVAAASQEVVAANQACGAKNYTTTLPKGTFITTSGSGKIEFDLAGNTLFSEPNNVIPAGASATFTYQASFDNSILGLKAGTQIRTETIVSFGNAGARGGSGASAPGFEIDGNDGYNINDDGAYVRSVPTRTSLTVPATCIDCNQLVNLTDTLSDIVPTGDVSVTDNTFSFTADNGDVGVSTIIGGFLIDGSQLADGAFDTFTVSVGYSVVDCSSSYLSNTAHLDTDQYAVSAPYSWDVNGDLLLQIGVDANLNPINVVICTGIDQQPTDTEAITSGDASCGTINPPPPLLSGYCTFLQSQWVHHPGDTVLNDLMAQLGSETIGTGGTHTASWDSAAAIEAYLPAGGTNAALDANLLDPTVTSAGHFGGEALALQLNVDLGANSPPVQVSGNNVSNFGNLLICGTGTQFDGQTVSSVLSAANLAVGGGALPTDCTGQASCDFNSLDALLQHVNVSFQQCHETGFAFHHLFAGACP
jgi:hypothetical protein